MYDGAIAFGNTYVYRVKAVTGAASSAYSTSAPVQVIVPAAPTNFNGSAVVNPANLAQAIVTLTWTDNATNETAYRLQRSTTATFTTATTIVLAANTTTYTDIRSRNTDYYYRLQAVNNITGSSVYVNLTPFPLHTP